jgi:hypothetical protein
MVTGQIGVIGVHVAPHVDQVIVNVPEIVLIRHLKMVVMTVQEWELKLGIVKRQHYVQV